MKSFLIRKHLPQWFLGIFVVLGVLMRVYGLGYRSLWIDEAWVANLVESQSFFTAILQEKEAWWSPLPIFFALGTKMMVSLLGSGEIIYRLLPCLFGIGAIAALWLLSREVFRPSEGNRLWMVPVALLALHPIAVRYSREVKQFSGELFFSIVLIYLYMRLTRHKASPVWISLYFLAAILAVGYGISPVFLIAALSLFLIVKLCRREGRGILGMVLPGIVLVAVAGAMHYFLWLRPQLDATYTATTWRPYWFAPDQALSVPAWLVKRGGSFFTYDFGFSTLLLPATVTPFLFLVLFCLGFYSFARNRDKDLLCVFCLVIGMEVILAMRSIWPLGGSRLNQFLLPFQFIFVTAGIGWLSRKGLERISSPALQGAAVALAAVILIPTQAVRQNLWNLEGKEEMRPIVQEMSKDFDPRIQRVYVYGWAREAFRYYWNRALPESAADTYYLGVMSREEPERYLEDVDSFLQSLPSGIESVYVVFSHVIPGKEYEKEMIIEHFRKNCRSEVSCQEETGACAYRFDV